MNEIAPRSPLQIRPVRPSLPSSGGVGALARRFLLWLPLGVVLAGMSPARAETVYYTLHDVILQDGTQMKGFFSWTFDPENFPNGTGRFLALDIPWTAHDQDDLDVAFDVGKSIEITLAGSVHDDGVDVTLFLTQPLTPTHAASIDPVRSRYEIGGNGFHDGSFLGGTITPVELTLTLTVDSPGFATLSWSPDIPGCLLQETGSPVPANWVNSASGGTNPVEVPMAGPARFYRVVKP